MNKLLIIILSVFLFSALSYGQTNLSPIYLKNFNGKTVLDSNLLIGLDESLMGMNDLVFAYNVTSAMIIDGRIIFDLFMEFDVRNLDLEISLTKIDKNDQEVIIDSCQSNINIPQKNKINRVFFRSCSLYERFESGDSLLVKVRQHLPGKIRNTTKIHHSSKYPSKILVPADFAFKQGV